EDDALATAAQMRERGAAAEVDAPQIGFDDPVPLRRRELLERAKAPDAGVVDEKIEAPELLDRSGTHRFDLRLVAHVDTNAGCAASLGGDPRGAPPRPRPRAPPDDDAPPPGTQG